MTTLVISHGKGGANASATRKEGKAVADLFSVDRTVQEKK
jgi:hypothetical protein